MTESATQVTAVSAVSRLKAANGEQTLSAETQQAIRNGALPPLVANNSEELSNQPESNAVKSANNSGGNEASAISQNGAGNATQEAVILNLSPAAQEALAQSENPPSAAVVTSPQEQENSEEAIEPFIAQEELSSAKENVKELDLLI